MASGEMSELEFISFLTLSLRLSARFSASGSLHFVCMDWRHMGELLSAGRQVYESLLNVCVWVKNNGGMGNEKQYTGHFLRRSRDLLIQPNALTLHAEFPSIAQPTRKYSQFVCINSGLGNRPRTFWERLELWEEVKEEVFQLHRWMKKRR
jgi:hypothetical protein